MTSSPLRSVLCVVLGGGRGTRLYPLTKLRAKPAVPIAGKYRLIDVPVSNCLNSGLNRVYILTQFNSASLHRHVTHTYKFDSFGRGFVEILAAQQTLERQDWYQGTADAVRQNLRFFDRPQDQHVLILAGDQLYQMDFSQMLATHHRAKAQVTISVTPVHRERVSSLGIMRIDETGRIVEFREKPTDPALLDALAIPPAALAARGIQPDGRSHLASMGIYLFEASVLHTLLDRTDHTDFGTEVIPEAIGRFRVVAHFFDGYWEDVGTIPSFYRANLALTDPSPAFDFYRQERQIYTRPRYLPAAKLDGCAITRALIADGCRINSAVIERSVIGVRSIIRSGARITDSIIMGADFYETDRGQLPLGIGKDVEICRAIVDKNVRIPNGCRVVNERGLREAEEENFVIRDGIVVIPKNTTLPEGTVI